MLGLSGTVVEDDTLAWLATVCSKTAITQLMRVT